MNSLKLTPRDFFIQLGATIALYISVVALINLVFSIIHYIFPDVLAYGFYSSSIAGPISVLVVFIPVLYGLERLIKKDLVVEPAKEELWIRRWRIYLTLFLTAMTIAIDIIVLINTYVSGETTSRFLFKFLAILLISAVVFLYYYFERTATQRVYQKIIAWVGILMVLGAIIGGFLIVGSPSKQRAIRMDNQRVSDLEAIQWKIITYWQQKERLPSTIRDVYDPLMYGNIPQDPETKTDYVYSVKGTLDFQLCATFSSKVEDMSGRGSTAMGRGDFGMTMSYPDYRGLESNSIWKHDVGYVCFDRTIDPDRYPSMKPVPL